MRKIILGLVLAVLLTGCSDNPGAKRLLENQGYKNVQTDGHAWFNCSKDDSVATKFTATNPNGVKVSGAVCRGFWAKGSTIRFDD